MPAGLIATAATCAQLIAPFPGIPETGPGYAIRTAEGLAKDLHGRVVVLQRDAACSFARLMQASQGKVRSEHIHSSRRSVSWNHYVYGSRRSKHLEGLAIDIHHSSKQWLLNHSAEASNAYGWHHITYGGHGGHFEYDGRPAE